MLFNTLEHTKSFKIKPKQFKAVLFLFLFSFGFNLGTTQEWKNLKAYQKESGNLNLKEGNWLKKDRKQNTLIWQNANSYNLNLEKGNLKYKSISEIRDFYSWFDTEIRKQGHEVNGVGVAAVAASQLSKLDNGFIRFFIVRNKEIVDFINDGSFVVFEFSFPLLQDLYNSDDLLKGEEAKNWSLKTGLQEQCEILEPLYNKLSDKALFRLSKMAKGKGIFKLGIPKALRFEGAINNCENRFNHAVNKLLPYYIENLNR
jgi:hypothetical protein